MALSAYLTATRRLLHDASGKYFSDGELTTDINSARQRIGLDTGSVRGLFTFYLSSDQEVYPYMGAVANITAVGAGTGYTSAPTISFSGGGGSGATATASISSGTVSALTITANGTGYTAAPTISFAGGGGTGATASASILRALDIISITVNYQNTWQMLGYANFTQFQARARMYRASTGNPEVWTEGPPAGSGGGRAVYVFYIPNTSYETDIDAIVLPDPLVDDATPEQLSYPATDLIPYYAAYLAKYNQQQFDESARFLKIYDELMKRGESAKFQRRIPNPYRTG